MVELSEVIAEANASVTVTGELVSVDQTDPVVRIYYGFEDGGFSPEDWNNSFIEVNGEILLPLETLTQRLPADRWRTILSGICPKCRRDRLVK